MATAREMATIFRAASTAARPAPLPTHSWSNAASEARDAADALVSRVLGAVAAVYENIAKAEEAL